MLNWLKNLFNKPKQPDPERELLEKIYEQDLDWEIQDFGEYVAVATDKNGKGYQVTVCSMVEKANVNINGIWFSADRNTWLQSKILKRAWLYVNKKKEEQKKKEQEDRKRKLKLINDNF